jgi:hypothetical protein
MAPEASRPRGRAAERAAEGDTLILDPNYDVGRRSVVPHPPRPLHARRASCPARRHYAARAALGAICCAAGCLSALPAAAPPELLRRVARVVGRAARGVFCLPGPPPCPATTSQHFVTTMSQVNILSRPAAAPRQAKDGRPRRPRRSRPGPRAPPLPACPEPPPAPGPAHARRPPRSWTKRRRARWTWTCPRSPRGRARRPSRLAPAPRARRSTGRARRSAAPRRARAPTPRASPASSAAPRPPQSSPRGQPRRRASSARRVRPLSAAHRPAPPALRRPPPCPARSPPPAAALGDHALREDQDCSVYF